MYYKIMWLQENEKWLGWTEKMAHNVVTQTSLTTEDTPNYRQQVEELRKHKKTLEGKLSGYRFLG